jgi:glycosyltransferase involved in cell wall biosynthesis
VKVAVVIPAFNEAAAVGTVVERACRLGTVVVVDDASTDTTGDIARAAGAVVVRHDTNRGYDAALASGFDAAMLGAADVIMTMDADGQHAPEIGEAILNRFADDAIDLVVGRRPRKARWSEHVFALYTAARFGLPDPLCGMKAFRSKIVEQHRRAMDGSTIGAGLTVAALASGARLSIVDVPVRDREGASRFGSGLRTNLRILRGLAETIRIDASATLATRKARRSPKTAPIPPSR